MINICQLCRADKVQSFKPENIIYEYDYFSGVGEIEVISSQMTSDLGSAVDLVNSVVQQLDVRTVNEYGSKLMAYLSKNNLQLLQKISAAMKWR